MLLICSKTNFEKTKKSTKIKMKTKKCAQITLLFPMFHNNAISVKFHNQVGIWFPKHRKSLIYFGKPSHAVKKKTLNILSITCL